MQTKPIVKKSRNKPRLVRLEAAFSELNFLDRVIAELINPLRQRKEVQAIRIREMLLDEGIDPDLLSKVQNLQVDTEECTLSYTLKVGEEKPPAPPSPPSLKHLPGGGKPESGAVKKKAAAKKKKAKAVKKAKQKSRSKR